MKLYMKNLLIVFSVIFVCSTATAYANCNYNGQSYPPGARLGPSTCMPNGSWQPPVQQPPRPQPPVQQPQAQQPQAQQPSRPPGSQPPGQPPQGQPPQPQVQQPSR